MAKTGGFDGPDALDILRPKEHAHALQHLEPDDEVLGVYIGASGQSLIAFGDRLVIVKTGLMAGATFGGKVTVFPYQDIVSIEENTGMVTAVIEVLTAAHSGERDKRFWSQDRDSDPYKQNHCIPTTKVDLSRAQGFLGALRRRIRESRQQPLQIDRTNPGRDDLASQLGKLATLHSGGVLSDDEFAAAKRKLLDG